MIGQDENNEYGLGKGPAQMCGSFFVGFATMRMSKRCKNMMHNVKKGKFTFVQRDEIY